jgi:signal transduction histidine kinase
MVPGRLRRIVTALVDNAVRHGAGDITVTADAGDEHTAIHVLDHGPGFPADFLPVAFDRFTRADTSRTTPGSGLGLAITAALVESYRGRAHARNRPHGGADVWIEIPNDR